MTTMVLDIGGTAIKSGLYTDGKLTEIREIPTEAKQGGPHVVERAKELIADYRQRHPLQRIGISTAGQVDPVRGRILYANANKYPSERYHGTGIPGAHRRGKRCQRCRHR